MKSITNQSNILAFKRLFLSQSAFKIFQMALKISVL